MASDLQEDMCLFGLLPKELVVEVMTKLSLQTRYYFIMAYPQYKCLGQISSLKRRLIKRSNICMNKENLQWLLDPNGTAIELSLDRRMLMKTYFDTAALMSNLQEVTLKNCRLHLPSCNSFIKTVVRQSVRKFLNELGKIRHVKFDGCTCFCKAKGITNDCWGEYISNEHYYSLKSTEVGFCQNSKVAQIQNTNSQENLTGNLAGHRHKLFSL